MLNVSCRKSLVLSTFPTFWIPSHPSTPPFVDFQCQEMLSEVSHVTDKFILRRTNRLNARFLPPKQIFNVQLGQQWTLGRVGRSAGRVLLQTWDATVTYSHNKKPIWSIKVEAGFVLNSEMPPMHGRHSEFIGKVMTRRLVILMGFSGFNFKRSPNESICSNLYQHYGATYHFLMCIFRF